MDGCEFYAQILLIKLFIEGYCASLIVQLENLFGKIHLERET